MLNDCIEIWLPSSDVSKRAPWPLVARPTSPDRMAIVACSAPTWSAIGMPAGNGGSSGSPVRLIRPPRACARMSNAPEIGVFAGSAEPGREHVDDGRVRGFERVVAEAEALDRGGAEVRQKDIGILRDGQQRFAPARMLQVEGQRALAAVVRLEVGAQPQRRRDVEVTAGIARAPLLHLDHVGAEVGEDGGRVRALLPDRQVEDADAFERSPHTAILALPALSVQNPQRQCTPQH